MKTVFTTTKFRYLLFAFVGLFHTLSFAVTKTSVASGNYSNGAIWSPAGVPGTCDDIVIASGHTVTLTANTQLKSLEIVSGGILNNSTFDVTLTSSCAAGGIYKNNGTHNSSTGSLFFENSNHLDGSGIINCDVIERKDLTIASTCNIVINGDFMNTGYFNFQVFNNGDVTLNGNMIIDGLSGGGGQFTNYSTGVITQTGNLTIIGGTSFFENRGGTYAVSGTATFSDAGSYIYNTGNMTIGGNVLGTGAGLNYFFQGQNAITKFGGDVFPAANDGDLLVSGSDYVGYVATTEPNTIEYNGGANQIIKYPVDNAGLGYNNNTYSNLIISNAGTKTVEFDMLVNGDLTIKGIAQMDTYNSNWGYQTNIDIKGNWINTSTNADPFLEQTGLVTFSGTGAQTISAAISGGETFYNYTLNNSGSGVSLSNNSINISHQLDLLDGLLTTGSYECVLTNSAESGGYGSPSNSLYHFGSTSYIVGNFRRYIDNGYTTYYFPLGNTDSYQEALLILNNSNFTGSNILGKFENLPQGTGLPLTESSRTYADILNCGGVSTGVGHAQRGIWTFTPNAGSATVHVYLKAMNYSNQGGGNENTIVKRTDSSSPWTLSGTYSPSSGSEPLSAQRISFNGFGQFAITSTIVPLGIDLIDFTAKCTKSKSDETLIGATINWATDTEKNNDHFTVEKSDNGFDWETKIVINGSGTKFSPTDYSYYDEFKNETPQSEKIVYYRLSQTDTDGNTKTLGLRSCLSTASPKIQLFPVPSTESVIVNFGDRNNVPNSFQVMDMVGNIVENIDIDKIGITWYKLDISKYASGRYLIKINDWKMKEDAVFIKK